MYDFYLLQYETFNDLILWRLIKKGKIDDTFFVIIEQQKKIIFFSVIFFLFVFI